MSRKLRIKTISTPCGDTSFLTMGPEDGQPLVLLHGFAGDKLTWQFFLQPLSRIAKLYAIDLPGHGQTQCPEIWQDWRFTDWLDEVISALDIQTPCILAHSMGGRIALDYASKHPVLELFLLSCAGLSPQFNSSVLKELAIVKDASAAEDLVRQMIGNNEKLVQATTKAMIGKAGDSAHATVLEEIIEVSARRSEIENFTLPAFDRINCPLHFFWGALDRIVPEPAHLPPKAQYTKIEGAGHMLPLEKPAPIIRIIKESLQHA